MRFAPPPLAILEIERTGNIPMSVWYIRYIVGQDDRNMQHGWIWHFARVLRLAGSHSINP